jgi:hypothetical protein
MTLIPPHGYRIGDRTGQEASRKRGFLVSWTPCNGRALPRFPVHFSIARSSQDHDVETRILPFEDWDGNAPQLRSQPQVGEIGRLRRVLKVPAMVKQNNLTVTRSRRSYSFGQMRQLVQTQIISNFRNHDKIELTARHLTRKFCLDKPDMRAPHAPFRLNNGGC